MSTTNSTDTSTKSEGLVFVQKSIGADTYMVMADSALTFEDEFTNLYYTSGNTNNVVLQPPHDANALMHLVTHNNILSQCVEAMEVNIDGTGFDIVPVEDGAKDDEGEKTRLEELFNEPYPGKSFTQIRRKLRRDMEGVGYAYLEVLTSVDGAIVGFRNLESYTMRMVKLDEPVALKKTLVRNGSEVEFTFMGRERRFVQRLGTTMIYYSEFGSSRQLNKTTGEWAQEGEVLAPELRATQLIYFNVNPDTSTPYAVPRWINQLPSVIGSRKAEESNLEFFDAGGMPPAIIFVEGGTLANNVNTQLQNYLSGKNKNKQRAVVVEAQSSSGSLESAGTVKVHVERFGSEKVNDAMFQNYDKTSEEHVRVGFRLPAMFIGRSADYNFATAVVSYMIAEEQVFSPERTEFDEIINRTIVKAMGVKNMKLKSRPITMKTVEDKLKALALVKEIVSDEDLVSEVNGITGMDLTVDAEKAKAAREAAKVAATPEKPAEATPAETEDLDVKEPQSILAERAPLKVVKLAHEWAKAQGIIRTKSEYDQEDVSALKVRIDSLSVADREAFDAVFAGQTLGATTADHLALAHACNHD